MLTILTEIRNILPAHWSASLADIPIRLKRKQSDYCLYFTLIKYSYISSYKTVKPSFREHLRTQYSLAVNVNNNLFKYYKS